ncbi:hypothetical protein BABINDRAFT_37776 [Babjeviella inositovora NRRL Y-12698]|uniref:Major facilitator superfamily (MFS) profile domain-containing protein n=1 Tax=Babjeviella inositovora NRRL Y-12698 TaxID=984486 RepID=A0A1E3QP95_9ASCO|nr:uncharacterized protein BABINDRAFT_37776 [Babjeviella inositovora NRRL Y-12698]ODQ79274.1 hypothetical protein BABINDRAFT_37776 [Babjeviella inositovora NRRL Y-12698]
MRSFKPEDEYPKLHYANSHKSVAEIVEEEFVPGTVHLVDLAGILNVKHNDGVGGKKDVVLIPQPSSNPNDPLSWSRRKKEWQFCLLWIWAFLEAASVNWAGPVWETWTIQFNCTFFQLNISSASCFLFLGLGCVFLQPTAMKLGRRFVYLCGTVLIIVANIIGSQANTVQVLYAVNIISGIAAAPVDSLVQISTTDVFFQHERATRLSLLTFALYAGSYLGPVACGYIVEKQSWRWCYYYQIIFFGVILVIQLFCMEDTTFNRPTTALEDEQEILRQVVSSIHELSVVGEETGIDEKLGSKVHQDDASSPDEDVSANKSLKRTYWQRMHLIEREYTDPRSWFVIFYRPVLTACFPAIVWGGVVYGVQIMWLSLQATTQSLIYSAPPFNFSTSNVGNTNFSSLIGAGFGMVFGGQFCDWLTVYLARRNNGIMEPEMRLWCMLGPAFINSAGLLLYGLGAAYGAHWFVSAGLGMAFIGFGIGSGGAITLTYAIDCYPDMASESLVFMLFVRNMVGCGFTFAIQPWLDRCGLKLTTWLMFMLSMVFNLSFLIFTKWGKQFRRQTKDKYKKFSNPDFTW